MAKGNPKHVTGPRDKAGKGDGNMSGGTSGSKRTPPVPRGKGGAKKTSRGK